jgi:hypothetical protein
MPFGGNFHPEWGALAPAPSFMRTARIVAVATAIGATAGAGVVLSLAGSGGTLGPQASSEAASNTPLVIVRSLVQPAEAAPAAVQPAPSSIVAATPVNVPAIAPAPVNAAATPAVASAPTAAPGSVQPPNAVPALPRAAAQVSTPMPSDSRTASTPAVPASVAALAEIPPATDSSNAAASDVATVMPDQSGAQKIGSKKLHGTDQTQQLHPQTAAANPQSPPRKRPEERGLGPMLRHLFSARSGSTFPN